VEIIPAKPNTIRNHTGIAFTLPRIPQAWIARDDRRSAANISLEDDPAAAAVIQTLGKPEVEWLRRQTFEETAPELALPSGASTRGSRFDWDPPGDPIAEVLKARLGLALALKLTTRRWGSGYSGKNLHLIDKADYRHIDR
jgi:hypothetical protein